MRRRTLLQAGAGMFLSLAASRCTTNPAQNSNLQTNSSPPQICIGFCPSVSGLPFYLALHNGWFKQAGLNVVPVKFSNAQAIAEHLINGKLSGIANSSLTNTLALAEIGQPSLFKILAINLRNVEGVTDKFIVMGDRRLGSLTDFADLRVGCLPSPQNVAITKAVLQRQAIDFKEIIPLEGEQHMAALRSGLINAAYYLEPLENNVQNFKNTRVISENAFAQHVLGNSTTTWAGSFAVLSTEFIQKYPQATQVYLEIYRRAVHTIRNNAINSLAVAKDYTPITKNLAEAIALSDYKLHNELTKTELAQLQSYFATLYQAKIFTSKVNFNSLLYS